MIYKPSKLEKIILKRKAQYIQACNELERAREQLIKYLESFTQQIVFNWSDHIIINTAIARLKDDNYCGNFNPKRAKLLIKTFENEVDCIGWNGIITTKRVYDRIIWNTCLLGGELVANH